VGRMDIGGTAVTEIEIPNFLGLNTAVAFSEIDIRQSPDMLNMLPGKIGSLRRRPGTVPLTETPLGSEIKTLCNLRKGGDNSILAASGDTLYKFDPEDKEWDAQTMTDTLESDVIDCAQFRDENANEVLIIADGGKLKYYDGTEVKEITPAGDDASPLPKNALATINTDHPPIGCIVHNNRVVIWDGSDTIWHSKIGYYDYFPEINYQRFVRENDHVVTCVSFQGALIVLMRRHVAVLFGDGYSSTPSDGDWSQDFLDTSEGCLNPRTVELVTYPDGSQEIFYLSDRGVIAINRIDTLSLDYSARYSTRSVTDDLIDWRGLGVTKDEWKRAVATFYEGKYWLIYPKGSEWKGLVFNTSDRQWYPIDGIQANDFYHDEDGFYFAGDDGHLKTLDETLHADYLDADKETKQEINAYWYSKLINPKVTGMDHFWDIIIIEARQFEDESSIDLEVNTYRGKFQLAGAVKTAFLIIGKGKIGESVIANLNFTDHVNMPQRIRTFLKGQYAQIKLSNNRDEPFEIFGIRYELRVRRKD